MNKFQWSPQKTVPGTIMSYGGNKKDQERANLIAYLASQSDSPPKLPVASAKPAAPATDDKAAAPAAAK